MYLCTKMVNLIKYSLSWTIIIILERTIFVCGFKRRLVDWKRWLLLILGQQWDNKCFYFYFCTLKRVCVSQWVFRESLWRKSVLSRLRDRSRIGFFFSCMWEKEQFLTGIKCGGKNLKREVLWNRDKYWFSSRNVLMRRWMLFWPWSRS